MIARLAEAGRVWEMLVIGGGATGIGIAVDAASRGYSVALVEQSDFGKGTSSRSTKLIHGGVRYLQQGHLPLVFEALRERGLLCKNAPHLVHDLELLVPCFGWRDRWTYRTGLKLYDWLAGRQNLGRSQWNSLADTLQRIPTLRTDRLQGGVVYHDGQFDDARLLVTLAITAAEQGAALANYVRAIRLTRRGDQTIDGVVVVDLESSHEWTIRAKVVINATGPFADSVRSLDDDRQSPMIAPSQGIHIVLDRSFLPGRTALLVPKTPDGRVMFAIPWYGATLVGTTDTPIEHIELEPRPLDEEIDFLLDTTASYLTQSPTRADVRSVFAGIRPLVRNADVKKTAKLARDHVIHVSPSGLVTIAGGKWTTYRHMAEQCVDEAAQVAGLSPTPCVTRHLKLHGWSESAPPFEELRVYGSDADSLAKLRQAEPNCAERLHDRLPYHVDQVTWAIRFEMARTLDDILARRTRSLLLDADAAIEAAPVVARILVGELQRDQQWQADQVRSFLAIARRYRLDASH